LDEVFENFAGELKKTGVITDVAFKKLGAERYAFLVDGCAFAKYAHDLLKPRDVACPYALVAMSIFQSVTGKKVKSNESYFTPNGAETIIEAIQA